MGGRRWFGHFLRAAIALALALSVLPLLLPGTPTAEAWNTGGEYHYSQDENALRTVGVSLPPKGMIDFVGSAERTESIAFTTSVTAGASSTAWFAGSKCSATPSISNANAPALEGADG